MMTGKIIICADRFEGFFCDGATIDDAYAEFVALHGNRDIEDLEFYEAVALPQQKGYDYD